MALLTIGMGLTSCDEQLDNAVVPGDNPETKEITLKDALVDKAVLKVSYKFNGSDCVFAYQYDAAKKAFVALDEGSDIPDEIYNNFEVTIAFDGSDKITQTVVDKSDNTKQYLLLNLYTAGSYDRIFRLSCEMKSLKVNDTEVLDKTNESVTPVSGFSVRPLADAINVGETGIFEALFTPSYATNQVVKFSSSNPSVITIDQTGKFTPVAAGTATLKAELLDGSGKIAEHTMTVNPATVLVTSVALDKTSLALTVGDAAVQLTATVAPDNASEKSVTWTSDKTSVATVDETGKVTAVAAGTATITAFANDESGKSATCTVTVTEVLATGITLSKTETIINYWSTTPTETLTATITPDNASNKTVVWSSDNEAVATVNATTGEITSVAPGTANITARTTDGTDLTKTCTVTVYNNYLQTPGRGVTAYMTFGDNAPTHSGTIYFKGKVTTSSTSNSIAYRHYTYGSYDRLSFNGVQFYKGGGNVPAALYISGGTGTENDPYVLSTP